MKHDPIKTLIGFMTALYLLHNDWWFWDDPQLVFGLPVGLCYHVFLCIASGIVLFLFVHPGED